MALERVMWSDGQRTSSPWEIVIYSVRYAADALTAEQARALAGALLAAADMP